VTSAAYHWGVAIVTDSDYALVTERCGLLRRDRGVLRLSGTEAADFLQGQVTNDVESLAAGQGCYALLLTHKGRIRTDMRILRTDDGFLLDTDSVGHPILLKTVQTFGLGRDVAHEDETAALAVLSLIGPGARDAVDSPPQREHAFVEGAHGLLVATDVGVDLIVPLAEVEAAVQELGVPEVGEEAAECVRIERGRPRLGIDIGGETIPEEAGLNERAVSFEKGCYVGQETVARLHYKGRPNRHLHGLRLSEPAASGDSVHSGERQVGAVGSTCVSPTHGPIALAILRREVAIGDDVTVGPDAAAGRVVGLPFG
jgi:tRNA-modifying protein YgfZ